jgi:magnesium transporter
MPETSSIAVNSLIKGYFHSFPGEAARLLDTMPVEAVAAYLMEEPMSSAVQIFSRLNPEVAANLAAQLDERFFAELFAAIDPSMAARLLPRLEQDVVESRLSLLPGHLVSEIRELMSFPPETAGFLMDARVVAFHPDDTTEMVLKRIRSIRVRSILNIYVLDDDARLVGVVPLHEVAVSQPDERIGDLIHSRPVAIQAMSPREEVVQLLEKQRLISLPVVDIDGKLLGIIRYDALVSAAQQDATEDVQTMFGAGRDERALSKASLAIRKRLPWLEINLATAFLASAVVGLFEDTIARITALAVFLPVVAGQSGNTGSQALAVTIRGLALREFRARQWFRVARKEVLVGLVNGCIVAFSTAVIVYFWASSFGLAAVIGISMVISMVIAGFSGAVIPILLKVLGQDPAQSSSIVLTTVTDIVGFLSFLGLATLLATALNIA